jgi:hypothetical protein
VGGASAALTGLLLREAKTLIVLLTPLLITILIAIPGQTTRLLGLELVATRLLTGVVSLIVPLLYIHFYIHSHTRTYRALFRAERRSIAEQVAHRPPSSAVARDVGRSANFPVLAPILSD